ncbi:MAG TPA: ABC transporter ATP-binding protein [Acidobacteriaceae bacterium]|nr:ABC transporter ATP-binding protein [Acidobacteriaceae bacterium]
MSILRGIVPEIACTRVCKQYRQGAEVLRDINFMVYKGEIISILGLSGCGKSTLLKMIAGLTSVSSGEITVNGMTPANARELVSFIFQDPTLLPWRTVKRNVDLGLELEGATRERRDAKTLEMLELVGLSEVAGRYPRELSGGMKMRVSIARALTTRPRILLMDEPFAALDEMTRDRMNDELLRLQGQHGWTIVFVTHSVAEAVFLSSRILVLAPNPGRLLEMVNVELDRSNLADARSSDAYEQEVSRVSRILRGAHLV